MAKYDFEKIESKWQKAWEEAKYGQSIDFSDKPKFYSLMEFPYPSGSGLHVGHCMGYTASDAFTRMKRMQGYNVLFPMGWDAFGLPTENYAIKTKTKPRDVTTLSIATFKKQMKSLGYSFDWGREVNTTDPNYYKWTQWIFMQFYKHAIVNGKLVEVADDDKETPRLAFQAEMPVNWCPSCKIILANEEVIGGNCERCGAQTEKRKQKQWMLRITAYADRLIKDLDTVDYLENIKTQQINWIGRSEGTEIDFKIVISTEAEQTSEKVDLGNANISDKTNKMLEAIDRINSEFKKRNIKLWVNGTFAVAGYCGNIFENPADVDLGVLAKDFDESKKIFSELGYSKIEDKDNGKFQVCVFRTDDFNIEIGTLDHDLGDTIKELDGHEFLVPDAKWLANCYKITAQKERRAGKNDLERAKFLESLNDNIIKVYTTRADTLFGVTYIVLAPEHELVDKIKDQISNVKDVENYIENAKKKSDMDRTELAKDKTGVELKGIKAINPINGEEVSVWIADYVLATYGTGAVMAVPAHDQRDFEFAEKYNIPIKEVIIPKLIDKNDPPIDGVETVERKQVYAVVINPKNNKVLALKWKKFPWIGLVIGGIEPGESIVDTAKREILEETGYKNVKFVRNLGGPMEVHFHATHKNVNRKATYYPLAFELLDEEQEPLSKEEAEESEPFWADWDEIENIKGYVLPIEHEIVRDRFHNPAHSFEEYGVLANSKEFDGLTSEEGKKKITEKLKEMGAGDFAVNFKLRDWIFSRQHYWGEPIPIIHCEKCGTVPMDEKDLPLTLPEVEKYEPTDTGESPLAAITDWVNTTCPKCGGPAKRETDTMPNWAGSSWYFIAYAMNQESRIKNYESSEDIFSASVKELKYWMPVDLYNGGNEHTTLHLLYSRFWHKFLYDLGKVPTLEPYNKRIAHGIILGADNQKMSKSRGNVVNPDDVVKRYGADALRTYIMFIGPYDKESAWNMDGLSGVSRFLNKVWENSDKVSGKVDSDNLAVAVNKLVFAVENDLERFNLNTYVAKLMTFNNLMSAEKEISKKSFGVFCQLLAPAAPHLAEELWEKLGNEGLVSNSAWPKFDESLKGDDKIKIAIQVNGKLRDVIEVDKDIEKTALEEAAKNSEKVSAFITGKEIKKVIVVPGKIVNIVI
ncbi:MAG: class I tRNA ligase family protein [Patescibacteria group bacterium]